MQSFYEFRGSASCPVNYKWLRVLKEMIAYDREERADSTQSFIIPKKNSGKKKLPPNVCIKKKVA